MTRRSFLQISALALTALGLRAAPEIAPELVRFAIQPFWCCSHKGGAFDNKASQSNERWILSRLMLPEIELDLNNLDPDLIPGHVTFTWEDGRTEKVRALVKRSEPQKIFALEV